MYSKNQVKEALKFYHKYGSVTKTIRLLGYPSRQMMYQWIHNEGKLKKPRKQTEIINTNKHPRNPPIEVKIDALHRCFELGECVKSVSEEIGYTRASIYNWRKRYLRRGAVSLMNKKNILIDNLPKPPIEATSENVEKLQSQMLDLQLEVDVLKETIKILKKDPGVNWMTLKNREKAVMVDALKNKYSLPHLLSKLEISKSSYYYQEKCLAMPDKYSKIRERVKCLFEETYKRYGYRRVHGLLAKEGVCISEKIIRRIMHEEGLVVKIKKTRKYNSYKGEITPPASNIIQQNFHSTAPNRKWLTDITEFAIPAGKVYLLS